MTLMPPRYFHGGPRGLRWIEPPCKTGAPSTASYGGAGVCRRDRVYVTASPDAALMYAAMHPSMKGVVYQVEPVGEVADDPDCNEPGLSFECERARVVKVYKFSGKTLAAIRKQVMA